MDETDEVDLLLKQLKQIILKSIVSNEN